MENKAPQRGPDADKLPPTIQQFHAANALVPVIPTDFNEITVHPLELERMKAERDASEKAAAEAEKERIELEAAEKLAERDRLAAEAEKERLEHETAEKLAAEKERANEELAAQITAENEVTAKATIHPETAPFDNAKESD